MESRIRNDALGTHIDWELGEVTPRMLDWFWCNMDKCDDLWHPNQHNGFWWFIGPRQLGSPLGTIHVAPQTWGNGIPMNIYIRMEPLSAVPEKVRALLKYDHAVIVAGLSLTGENVRADDPALGYRVHQWQKTDGGVVGMSSAVEVVKNDAGDGGVWAAHAREEVGNWEVFLPDLYRLYKVITRRDICPYYSFRLVGTGKDAVYAEI